MSPIPRTPAARPAAEPARRIAGGTAVASVAFSPDGHTLASGDDNGTSGCGTSPIPRTPGRSASR